MMKKVLTVLALVLTVSCGHLLFSPDLQAKKTKKSTRAAKKKKPPAQQKQSAAAQEPESFIDQEIGYDEFAPPPTRKKRKGFAGILAGSVGDFFKQAMHNARVLFKYVMGRYVDGLSEFFYTTSYKKSDELIIYIDHLKKRDDLGFDEYEAGGVQASSVVADRGTQRQVLGQTRGGEAFEQIAQEEREMEARKRERERQRTMFKQRYSKVTYPFGFAGAGDLTQGFASVTGIVESERLASFMYLPLTQSFDLITRGLGTLSPKNVFLFKLLMLSFNFNIDQYSPESDEEEGFEEEGMEEDFDEESKPKVSRQGKPLPEQPSTHEFMAELFFLFTRLSRTQAFSSIENVVNNLPIMLKPTTLTLNIGGKTIDKFIPMAWALYQDVINTKATSLAFDVSNFKEFGKQLTGAILTFMAKVPDAAHNKSTVKSGLTKAIASVLKRFASYGAMEKELDAIVAQAINPFLAYVGFTWKDVKPTVASAADVNAGKMAAAVARLSFDLYGEVAGYAFVLAKEMAKEEPTDEEEDFETEEEPELEAEDDEMDFEDDKEESEFDEEEELELDEEPPEEDLEEVVFEKGAVPPPPTAPVRPLEPVRKDEPPLPVRHKPVLVEPTKVERVRVSAPMVQEKVAPISVAKKVDIKKEEASWLAEEPEPEVAPSKVDVEKEEAAWLAEEAAKPPAALSAKEVKIPEAKKEEAAWLAEASGVEVAPTKKVALPVPAAQKAVKKVDVKKEEADWLNESDDKLVKKRPPQQSQPAEVEEEATGWFAE